MKTKSKRFLNLATLCLALLGTTLLMGQPVKAEEMMQKSDYMAQFLEGDSDEYPADLEARYKGYVDGYKEGLEGRDVPKRPNIQVPKDVPSSNDTEYKDGYEEGFAKGQHKRDSLGATKGASQESEERQKGSETPEDSQRSEERQKGSETPEDSQRSEERQKGSETPEDSQRSEERQEESDNQQGDMLTPIVDAIVEAWGYVLSWFNWFKL
ncbi:Uncharacterised protein [Streptococcus pyogenes]|uniref:hypothetical protein n=1 Tax=Streptococcus pyogenes TaxID=1314 RepID=UPI0010F260DD|nr:hypothetical protein [Streptococcus pyogenes]VGW54389.1 Uncharacterised protein [Streptococcus pyogenes]VGX74184.1 Uncharacterised protein [Streptococcus pyogenes]VGX84802.1 Uncharacterised protein [Streptococcus pyogenes]VGY06931.1 Uncharacterised protein [Streptococcus pyogenes]VGY15531.1 Uncharacterised protein [Streptococcus pyogenes]